MKSVLVITQETDFHVPPVKDEVNKRGFTMKQVNLADFPIKMSLSAHLDGNGMWESPQENFFDKFTSIWYRRPELYHASSQDLANEVRKFLEREAYYAFIGLLESCQNACLVSSPMAIQRAAFKVLHLATAQRLGIHVPKTLITNEPEEVKNFFDKCNGSVICKSIYSNSIKGDNHHFAQIIYTTIVTNDHLEKLEGVREAAHLFQQAITDCRDIRVTIFGKRCIATEIIYNDERSNVDWRTEYHKHIYIKHTLPHELEEKLLAFVKSYGLQFSTIDLLLNKEDETYYLIDENPSGQFYWIEQKNPEIKLSSAMADLLCFPQEFRL